MFHGRKDSNAKQNYDPISITPLMVSNLIDQANNDQNLDKLYELFEDNSVQAIKRIIIIPATLIKDKLLQISDPKGRFTVQNKPRTQHLKIQKFIGKSYGCQMLIWIGTNVLPKTENLAHTLNLMDKKCSQHLPFLQLLTANKAIWIGCIWGLRLLRILLAHL